MTQSLSDVFTTLFSSIATLFATSVGTDGAPVLVSFGPPGEYQPSAIVAIMDCHGEIERPTLGTNRSREMAAAIEVTISVYTPGDESAQQVSLTKACELLDTLEDNLRLSPNERLGGACRDAWISSANPKGSVAMDPELDSVAGRVTDIEATITALIRY
jgi:hypothetical protein